MKVNVIPYNPKWGLQFESEKELLLKSLKNIILRIHHIGSTSVEGLAAKPIIDILLEVTALEELDKSAFIFEELGYEPKGEFGIEGRRYYRKGRDHRTHHIHAFKEGDENILRHLAFRDYLRTHPNIAKEYQALKEKLAKEFHDNTKAYCDGKDAFIKHYEKEALKWKSTHHS